MVAILAFPAPPNPLPAPAAVIAANPSTGSAVLAAPPDGRALPSAHGRRGEYGVGDLARELKLRDFSPRVIIDKLRALAKHDGLPLPRTPRFDKGRPIHGPNMIYRRSRWDAGEVDAWLDGRSPAGPAAPLAAPFRAEMAARAARLAQAPLRSVA